MSQIWLVLLSLVTLAVPKTSAISKKEAAQATLDQESVATAAGAQGFLQDINFRSFFEEVGLIGAESKSGNGRHRSRREPSALLNPSAKISKTLETSESQQQFTVINTDDDFFAAASNPFERFHEFSHDPTDPYAASHHNRDYISPFASSSRSDSHKVAFDDYGPPKDFFDSDFVDFNRKTEQGQGHKKSGSSKAEKERPSESKVDDGIDHDPKTKKCREEERDGMVCEICKDDFGGFSEHCAHRVHSGKDQKYANSRRTGKGEAFDPVNHGKSGGPKTSEPLDSRPHKYSRNHEKSGGPKASESLDSRPHKYSRDDHDEYDHKKSPFSDRKKDHSFSSASIPSHTSSKHSKTHHKDDNYAPPSSVKKEYKPFSKTTHHSYEQVPKNTFKKKQFDHFDHEKAAFDNRKSHLEIPEDTYDAQKESHKLEEAAFQKILQSLKENQAPTKKSSKKHHQDHRPLETKKNFNDDPEQVKEYSNPSPSAYSAPTHKSSAAPSTKTYSSDSANTVENSVPEGKDVAVFAKKSIPRRKPSSYAETESKKVYKPKKTQDTKPVYGRDSKLDKDHKYEPFPEPTVNRYYDPYNFDDLYEFDLSSDLGPKHTVNDYGKRVFSTSSTTVPKSKGNSLNTDVVRQASQRDSYPNTNSHHRHHDDGYRQLDPAENFKVIGQMVKQFSRKDRTHCKKRINKDGMTCYICPNKHGQVDEDCVYENNNPEDGVHLMYREESSY